MLEYIFYFLVLVAAVDIVWGMFSVHLSIGKLAASYGLRSKNYDR
jgi:hypothetical protein